MDSELHRIAAERLASAKQRYTATRKTIVEVLGAADRPLTLADVLAGGNGTLAQSSVYRNLSLLEGSGVIRKVVAADEFARFELAEDLSSHHHHLICSNCGTVADFTLPERVERSLNAALGSLASDRGFQDAHHRLDLVGTCSRCS